MGLSLVALFAAAMSSLDSVINSLSASTMEDFIRRFRRGHWTDRQELWVSRFITLAWGALTIVFSFYVGDISSSVLVAINKIGSLINGPVLGVFTLGIFTKRANGNGVVLGLLAGFLFNLLCWIYLPDVSWLWWNVFGFLVSVLVGYGASLVSPVSVKDLNILRFNGHYDWLSWKYRYLTLVFYSVFLIAILWLLVRLNTDGGFIG